MVSILSEVESHLFLGLLGLVSSLLLLGSILEHTLNNLLLLDQESSNNSVLDTVGTERATICTLNSLSRLGDISEFSGSQSRNTSKIKTALTTLGSSTGLLDVKVSELSARGLDDLDLVGSGVV